MMLGERSLDAEVLRSAFCVGNTFSGDDPGGTGLFKIHRLTAFGHWRKLAPFAEAGFKLHDVFRIKAFMKHLASIFAVATLMLYGCAESAQHRAQRLGSMLSAAGFHMLPADTPQREQELTSHTPLKIRYHFSNGKPHYWFADPYACNCVYVGNEAAFQKYQQLKFQQQIVQSEQTAAEMNENAAEQEQFNFMMWPGSPFFY